MATPVSGNKHLEYINVYIEYEHYGNSISSCNHDILTNNFDENMQEFDAVVNQRLEDGWELLGPPIFSQEWFELSSNGFAVQTLVREKNVEQAIVVDVNPDVVVAECVNPLRSSKRLTRSNS